MITLKRLRYIIKKHIPHCFVKLNIFFSTEVCIFLNVQSKHQISKQKTASAKEPHIRYSDLPKKNKSINLRTLNAHSEHKCSFWLATGEPKAKKSAKIKAGFVCMYSTVLAFPPSPLAFTLMLFKVHCQKLKYKFSN